MTVTDEVGERLSVSSVRSRRRRPGESGSGPTWRTTLIGATVLACATALTACGRPPELRDPSGSAAPFPSGTPEPSVPGTPTIPTPPPSGLPSVPPPPATSPPWSATPVTIPSPPSPTGRPTAPRCAGAPSGDQVLAALRRTDAVLPQGATLRVKEGPFCAGDWQYAVVQLVETPEPEPLQVLTRGRPGTLTVVTTGTDVCTTGVRAGAPVGIQALACDVGTAAAPS